MNKYPKWLTELIDDNESSDSSTSAVPLAMESYNEAELRLTVDASIPYATGTETKLIRTIRRYMYIYASLQLLLTLSSAENTWSFQHAAKDCHT